jgi:hypothetical protein
MQRIKTRAGFERLEGVLDAGRDEDWVGRTELAE